MTSVDDYSAADINSLNRLLDPGSVPATTGASVSWISNQSFLLFVVCYYQGMSFNVAAGTDPAQQQVFTSD
jgi:hypothetical protein